MIVSTLTLVRHGQAQIFQRNGAALSTTGEKQAETLARFWIENGVTFDEVWTGALPRQRQTEQIVAACFHAGGNAWPQAACDAAWNEYDAPGVLSRLVPSNPRLAELDAEFQESRGGPDEYRRFQRMFEAATSCWIEHPDNLDGVESFPQFRARVSTAVERIMAGPPSRRVAVFTSGGPIGLAIQVSMRAPDRAFLEVNWRVRNASVTEFVFDRSRFTLDSFNSIAHLLDRSLWTYR